jgi:transaldolase
VIDEVEVAIKIFADGADLDAILDLATNPLIKGFTTNPTLMRKSGVSDYEGFARKILDHISDRPISFEVFSDEFNEMERQARSIASWGHNVYVKIPITNTCGQSSTALIRRLSAAGVRLNITAILSLRQVRLAAAALDESAGAIVSVFAGRIADTGRDPVPLMSAARELLSAYPTLELLWASPREVLNVIQAVKAGCHIITVTHDLLNKLGGLGRDLDDVSLDTVRMFRNDAVSAGFVL